MKEQAVSYSAVSKFSSRKAAVMTGAVVQANDSNAVLRRQQARSSAIHNSLMGGLPLPDSRTLGLLEDYVNGLIGASELMERGLNSCV